MSSRRTKPTAPPLTDEQRQQLLKSLQPYQPNEPVPTVYRGNAVSPLVSVRSPASGRFPAHGVRLIGDCAQHRGLTTRTPGALQRLKSAVPGIVIMEPVVTWNPMAVEQYELKWYKGNTVVRLDLLPILQPINMTVPRGYVMEVPISMEKLNDKYYLLLHLSSALTRSVKPAEEKEDEEDTDKDKINKNKNDGESPTRDPQAQSAAAEETAES